MWLKINKCTNLLTTKWQVASGHASDDTYQDLSWYGSRMGSFHSTKHPWFPSFFLFWLSPLLWIISKILISVCDYVIHLLKTLYLHAFYSP